PGQAHSQPRGGLRALAGGQHHLGDSAPAVAAQVEPRPALQLLQLDPPELRDGLGLGQLAGQEPAQHLLHFTSTQSSRSRGPSNSHRKTACQRPRRRRPPSTGSSTLGPTAMVLMCESELPSEWEKPPSRGTSDPRCRSTSACTSGSQPSLTVTAHVVCGEKTRQRPSSTPAS